ncbi:NAD(P)-binding protein [Backusella circina FSU 941]|nr:NAD(P)-binding protein [Backusella circina FSU 941]
MLSVESLSSVNGKVAVLTGASRGLGKAIADKLIENGAKVVIGDILEKEGNETVAEYNEKAGSKVAAFIRTDVTKYQDNIALFKLAEKEFGGVDIALLNAGIINNSDSMFTPLDDELEERMININTTAVIKGTKVALLHMAKRGGGVVLHLASVAGLVSAPELSSYNASKFGVVGYTRSFGLMPTICNVRVNASE